jgi:hypothetical protein
MDVDRAVVLEPRLRSLAAPLHRWTAYFVLSRSKWLVVSPPWRRPFAYTLSPSCNCLRCTPCRDGLSLVSD